MPIDQKAVLKLILEMLKIDGLSGKEGNIAAFIIRKLRAVGIPAASITTDNANKRSPLGGETGNLICTLPGTIKAPRRLLAAHIDTVPLCAGTQPVVKDGYIVSANPKTGLGGDNRSGAAAILYAATEIVRRKLPHPPLTFFWPVQEEVGLYGARFVDVAALKNPVLCFNWDGSKPEKITIGATGAYVITIRIEGLASHAGVAPEKGVSAIAIASLALAELYREGWHGQVRKGKYSGTSNFGTISGGSAVNVVPESATIVANVRSNDARFREKMVAAYRKAFEKAIRQVKSSTGARGSMTFDADLRYDSFLLKEDAPVVVEAQRVLSALGLKPELRVTNGGLDANWLTAHGLPTVTLGAGQCEVHTVSEKLELASFYKGCEAALRIATRV
ncbi:MAG TPA: M20/M25/M40 family metallo-hydrolase [Planctomycetota bacterium]|nr:M20/M25/M40 family metallo-hydrolase [Planctomycetota bacterium]